MKKIFYLLFFQVFFNYGINAQLNFGAKIGTGASRLINSEKVLSTEPTPYAYDITPDGNVFDYNIFINRRINKTFIRLNLAFIRNDFKIFYRNSPEYFLTDKRFSYGDKVFPIFIQTEFKFRHIYSGLEISHFFGKKWSVGIGINYGIRSYNHSQGLFGLTERQKNSMITKMVSNVPIPSQINPDLVGQINIVWSGYQSYDRHPLLYKFNARYNVGERFALVGEYQHNFVSFSTINDYRFHLLTLGLECSFFKH